MSPTSLPVLIPELVDAAYTGTVVSSHEGYCFISDVKQGYSTVNTNGHVFCPVPLPQGATVEFDELNDDRERPRRFRTHSVRVLATPEFGVATIDRSTTQIARAEKILALSKMCTMYHSRSKKVTPEEARKAAENGPFAAMAYMAEAAAVPDFNLALAVENFLRNQFSTLADMGFSCAINGEVDEAAEQRIVEDTKATYTAEGLGGQSESLQREYEELRGIRSVFRMLHANSVLSAETIVPIHYLPDLLVTAPVWYIWSSSVVDQDSENDPLPDEATRFFCDRVGTREFAWLYQIYNRRTRPVSRFAGREISGKFFSDTMPPRIVKVLSDAKKVFDFVVIATPYHDVASREWADPNWLRNIDPFLFGFFKRLDFMFMLGRWSGTGLFPLMCEMVADTIAHLSMNKAQLANFPHDAWWYRGGSDGTNRCLLVELVPFAEQVIAAFERGELFQFLRGELKEEAAEPMA